HRPRLCAHGWQRVGSGGAPAAPRDGAGGRGDRARPRVCAVDPDMGAWLVSLLRASANPARIAAGHRSIGARCWRERRRIGSGIGAALMSALSYVPWLVLIPILAFFLMKDAASLRRTILTALPHHGQLRGHR